MTLNTLFNARPPQSGPLQNYQLHQWRWTVLIGSTGPQTVPRAVVVGVENPTLTVSPNRISAPAAAVQSLLASLASS